MLDDYVPDNVGEASTLARTTDGRWLLDYGIYTAHLEGYCLQPGAARGRGDQGYGDAPYKGEAAAYIQSILRNRDRHPSITQQQTQTLIWAVLAKVPLLDMPPEQQMVARRLLSPDEVRRLEVRTLGRIPSNLLERLLASAPAGVRQMLEAESRLRLAFADLSVGYSELEQIAVPGPPADDRDQSSGRWSYRPAGFFVRYEQSAYQDARAQYARPHRTLVARDAFGRIVAVEDPAGRRVDVQYDPPLNPVFLQGSASPLASKIGTVTVSQPTFGELQPSRSFVWTPQGWTFTGGADLRAVEWPSWQARSAEDAAWKTQLAAFVRRTAPTAVQTQVQQELASALDLLRLRRALWDLRTNDDSPAWAKHQLDLLAEAFQFEVCRSLGGCTLDQRAELGQPPRFMLARVAANLGQAPAASGPFVDPADGVAVPPNEEEQRTGRSRAPKECPSPQDIQKLEDALRFQEAGADLSRRFLTSPSPDGYLRDVEGYENWLRDQLTRRFGGVTERGNATGDTATVNDACVDSPASICGVLNQATSGHEFQHQLDLRNMNKRSEQLTDREAASLEQRGYERSSGILRKAIEHYRASCSTLR